MKPLDAQSIVDTVYFAFGPMGLPRSVDDTEEGLRHCLYAGPNGTGCAVGVLIPRPLARRMDERAVGALPAFIERLSRPVARWIDKALEPVAEALAPHVNLLRDLQCIHDDGAAEGIDFFGRPWEPGVIADGVRAVAAHHGLLDPARHENDDVDARLADLLGDAFRETHDNLVPA